MTAIDARGHRAAPPLGGVVSVSPMRRRHLGSVLAIEERSYPRPWPRLIFEAELDRPDRRYLVALEGRVVVGYGGVLDQGGDVHLTTVAVDPAVRGRGVASRVVFELIGAARTLTDDGGLTLEVRAGNTVAQHLYERFGFTTEGRRPRYYADNGEDALVMWLRDLHGPGVSATLARWAARFGLPTTTD